MQYHLPEVSRKAEIRRVGGCDRSAVLIEWFDVCDARIRFLLRVHKQN